MDELEKEIDEFLAGDDGLEILPWGSYVERNERAMAACFSKGISRQHLDQLIRLQAKTYVAHLKGLRLMAALSGVAQRSKTIRSDYIKTGLETIANYEAASEVVMKYIDELPGKVRSETGKNAVRRKLENDPKQVAKEFVKQCWLTWQEEPERYQDKTKFANDMLKQPQCAKLTSAVKITTWCRDWEKKVTPC